MTKELYEINRKLDLIMQALGIDEGLISPKGQFAVAYKGMQLWAADYYGCLDYVGRCQDALKGGLEIVKLPDAQA